MLSSKGLTNFGEVTADSGLPAAPIKLSIGENTKDVKGKNHGYGLLHIEASHGTQIRKAGFHSIEEFVENVAENYDTIREGSLIGKKQTYLLEVSDEHNNTLFVQLSRDGQYWNVNSAGIFREAYSRRKPKVASLPTIGSNPSTETAEVNRDHSMDAVATSGNSSTTSADKVTESSEELQGKEDKFTPAPIEDGEDYVDYAARVAAVKAQHDAIKAAENATDTNPTEGQKKAGNYKKGHVQIGAFDISVEQPKGSVRRGKDADGKEWESKMNNTYGYFRGTEGVDGDHIDVFLSNDIDGWNGRKVFVVDQYNPDGTFDEHKVMLGFNDADDAKSNYLANYEKGWGNGRRIDVSTTNLEDFEKWISSSHRKTKPFAEYKGVKIDEVQSPSAKYQPIIQATFNKIKREQGIIEPIAEKKRKPFTVFDITIKDPRRPMFGGVYHDGGMAVATNGIVMFVHKEAYDKAKEGKIITSKGDVIEGKFPEWKGAIPKETIPTGLQTEPLLEFVNGALARMKAEKAKKYEVDGALAYIKFQDGNVVCCQLVDLQKMLRAAKSVGADDLRFGTDKEVLVAESPAGKAIVIIQGEEKARYNAGYNNFAYEAPTVKGEEEVSDGALDNPYPSAKEVEQEAKEATKKIKEERNEERVARTQKKRGRPTKAQQEYRKRKERETRKKEAKKIAEEYKRLSEETDELRDILEENKDASEELVIAGFHSEASWVRATAAEHKNLPPSLLEEAIADPSLRKYAIKNKNITDSQFHHAVKLSLKDGNTEFFRSLNSSDDRLTEEESLSIMEFMWKAYADKRYGTIYFSSKYPSVLRRFYENHGTQLLAQKVLARNKNTPQDILETLYESGNEEIRLEIAGNDSVPISVVLKMLDLPNNLAFREKLANRRNLPQDIISRLFHDNSKSVRQTIIRFQPLALELMDKILKKKNITELGLLTENRNTPLSIQDSILAISDPPKSWGVNGDYYLREIQKKARLGIAQNKRASASLLEDLYNEISSGRLLSDSDLGEAIAEHPNTSKSVLADIYSRFGEKYPRIKNAIEKRSDFTEQEVDENTGNVVLKQFSDVHLSANTESQRLATDAALEGLKRAGVPVEVVSDEQAAAMLGKQKGVELSAKQKRALETASPAMQDHHTVVSSADGTKVLKDLDNTIEEYEKLKGIKQALYSGEYKDTTGLAEVQEVNVPRAEQMKTPSGTLYGWTVGGKIYLTKDGLNPNTPIHEYTHLWARAMKERNKEGWQSVKELLRDTPVWDEVLKDKNYQDILDDEDAIASEALSRISGQKNAEKMEAEARKMIDEAKDYVDKAKAISLLERMKNALEKFWNWVGKDLFGIKKFSSVDEVTDRVLYDLTNGTDLKGVASEKVEKQQVSTDSEEERAIIERAKEDGFYMKAPNGEPTRLTEKQWAQVRTKAFKSWFGDWENNPSEASKVVDENGEPMVFYHNTNNNFSVFDSKRNGTHTDAGWLGDGFYFYGDENEGSGYGNIKMGVFLNVRDPYYATSEENNQLAEANSRDMSVDFRENLEEEGYDGVFYNGDLRQEAVVFEPNQIKSATDNNGEFSQESDDIRYRESKGSSERTLVGIHNISADKLSKAIKQGGLANPSVAVIDISKQQHTGYGEISLIMPSDKINKRTGKNAGTFEGDAWTPMYPSVERQMSREGSLVMEHDIKALPNEMQLGVRNALRNWLDSRVDTKLSYLYLFQQGKAPDFETIKPKYNKEVHRAFGDIMHEVTNVYDLSKNDIEKLVDLYVKTELNGDINEFNQSYERNIAKHKEILSNKKPGSLRYKIASIYLRDAEKYGRPIDVLQRFVDEVWRDKNTQGRVSIEKTFDAANKKIKEDGLENDYKKWTDGLNERYHTKEVIFDGFTPSGMRRYIPNTLENVSKLMKKQGRNASNGIGSSFSNFAASVMKANASLDSIRKKKDKLTNDHQDLDDFEEKWQNVYVDLSRKLQPDAKAYDDYGFARLQEAASEADPQAYLQKEYGVTLSDEDTQRLKDMVKAIKEERPSMYFETKFERPVTFDEFAAAVVPHNTDAEIKQQLRDAGLKVVEYEAGNEESRAKAVEEASKSDDIRFRQGERATRELAEVNERFNEELQKQIDGTLPAGHVYQLGMPGEILLATGIPNLPIQMNAKKLKDKATSYGHDFDLSEVKDLVNVLQHPLALFSYGDKTKAQNIIVSLQKDGNNFIVGLSLNPSVGGHKLEINSIRNVFPKKNAEWLNWISHGKALYIDKEKVQNLIDQQRTILADVDYLDLDSAANILKDFENPTIDGKNHIALSENALLAEASHDREAMRNKAVQLSDKLHTPIKIVEDVKDITHSNAEVERRKRNSKGWYDVRTGEVVVVLPNNRDVEDVAATVMHETVAHKGLRELVGEEHYDNFLDEVYEHLRGDLKQRVDAEAGRSFVDDTIKNGEKAKNYEQHRRTAVDELFGDMAEKPFEEFSEGERTLWQKLKEVVRKLLDKFLESLKLPKWFELGDNELRYMLWRSHENLRRGKEHPIDMARDMVMREELGLSDAARMRMGDTPDTFKARQRRAVEEKGVVMPGLNSAEVKVVDVPRHSFTGTGKDAIKKARVWANDNIVGTHTAHQAGNVFEYNINSDAVDKFLSSSSTLNSENLGVHIAVLTKLPDVIDNSIEVEEHPDYKKVDGKRNSDNGIGDGNMLVHRMYGAVEIEGKIYRVKTTIHEHNTKGNVPHDYRVTKIELIISGSPTSNALNSSIKRVNYSTLPVAKLLKDVEKSYDSGKKVLDESRKADENPILYRDGGETEDIWKDKSMGLHERTTAAAMRLADKHQENKTLRNDAMRAIGNNLADLRKAMSLQRKFDMATVKRVSDLARVLMNNGYIGDMTQQEVKSLLAAVRNSVGHNDIDRDVQKVMEIMVKNQLRRAEKALGALESIKGSKVNAKGVKVQGKLDAAGGQLMEVFKKTRGWEKNDIEEAIADAQGRMSSDDATVAENATIEYAGLQFAMEYAEKIRDSKVEESRLKEEIKKSHEETSERNRNSESYRQYIASLQDAILQNKIERAEAYFNLVGRLSDGLRESMANATQFKKMEKMRINEIHHYANSDMQGMSIS